ncbi:MAG: carboxy-S-adenosyl-L-methionine synthase CmoA [Desulfobulbaceae bacterium]|nr:carboxy-S-adenosyl-L-methionine synthase CmoA [Desulfobulbaceae bacterium]
MKDTLFIDPNAPPEDFQFSPKVAEVFDDMLERSVPFYKETMSMVASLLETFVAPHQVVYDLGCSTGATMIELARRLSHLDLHFIGVDNSAAMIEKATLKAEIYCKSKQLNFAQADILNFPLDKPAAIILNYTLQFIRPLQRLDFVRHLHDALSPGGLILIAEKTISHQPLFNRAFIGYYLDFKRRQGYSEIEIAKKREALENVLVPFSAAETMELLHKAGFGHVEQFFQWFNFSGFVARKAETSNGD